jgi:hypothetical protein
MSEKLLMLQKRVLQLGIVQKGIYFSKAGNKELHISLHY